MIYEQTVSLAETEKDPCMQMSVSSTCTGHWALAQGTVATSIHKNKEQTKCETKKLIFSLKRSMFETKNSCFRKGQIANQQYKHIHTKKVQK
jgi:hypothetical protein